MKQKFKAMHFTITDTVHYNNNNNNKDKKGKLF